MKSLMWQMKSNDYFKDRFLNLEKSVYQKGSSYLKELEKQYKLASYNMEKEISRWYSRFAANNEISLAYAKTYLDKNSLEEFKWNVEDYIKYAKENSINGNWVKQLENASARVHISKLEALKIELQQKVEVLYGNKLDELDNLFKTTYKDVYYKSIFETQKGFNVGWKIQGINENKLDKLLKKPWTKDGKDFSSRIWTNKKALINSLHTNLTQNVIRGDPLDKVVKQMSEELRVDKNKVARLVYTESSYFSAISERDSYIEMGLEEYEVLSTLDTKTSDLCRSLDGKVFKVNEFAPGVTANPFHPRCRTTTVPYFDDEFSIDERVSRDKDGKTVYVPSDMKYNDWYDKFIKNNLKDSVKSIKIIDNYDEWSKNLTDEERNGLYGYTSGDLMGINTQLNLRGVKIEDLLEDYPEIKHIDSAIEKYNLEKTKVYRVVKPNALEKMTGLSQEDFFMKFFPSEENAKELESLLKGKTQKNRGYLSTSTNIDEIFRLYPDSNIFLEIDVPDGAKGAKLGKNSAIPEQDEILFARDTDIEFLKVEYKQVKWIDDYGDEQVNKVFAIKGKIKSIEEDLNSIETDNIINKDIERIKLDLSMFPGEFNSKTEIKNTKLMCDFINNLKEPDPHVLKLYSKMRQMESVTSNNISFKISHASGHSVKSTTIGGKLSEVKLTIPKLHGDNLTGQINTTLHENMHLIDLYLRDISNNKWFTTKNKILNDSIEQISEDIISNIRHDEKYGISEDVRKLFDDFHEKIEDIPRVALEDFNIKHNLAIEKYKNNEITYKDYKKEYNNLVKNFEKTVDYEQRNALGGGISNLQDIYDALSNGYYRDFEIVKYGHGSQYYSNSTSIAKEILANYGSLSITRPDLIKMLRQDKPQLVKVLEETIQLMLKEVD